MKSMLICQTQFLIGLYNLFRSILMAEIMISVWKYVWKYQWVQHGSNITDLIFSLFLKSFIKMKLSVLHIWFDTAILCKGLIHFKSFCLFKFIWLIMKSRAEHKQESVNKYEKERFKTWGSCLIFCRSHDYLDYFPFFCLQ